VRTGQIKTNGRECNIYESFFEVQKIAHLPSRYCDHDATELIYYSFFDNLDRFTLKSYCPTCKADKAVSIQKDKYEENMLKRWAKQVKERAEYRCEMASPDCSGPLHAHHMIPKHLEPNRKYDVTNGVCLCEAHHKKVHKYM